MASHLPVAADLLLSEDRPVALLRPGTALRVDFWRFVPLARSVRVVLVILVAVTAAIEALLRASGELGGGALSFTSSLLVTFSLLLMAWCPPVSAAALLFSGFVAVAAGEGGSYLTALSAGVGLVLFTCSVGLSFAFCATGLAWIVAVAVIPPGLRTGGVLTVFVIALSSAVIGRGIRMVVDRNYSLRRELDSQTERLALELQAERNRIADELHDVIAHDIAIVAMHARVLERSDDASVRSASQRAISDAAGQALADTRRILHLIHGSTDVPEPSRAATADIRTVLGELEGELRALGDDVVVEITDGPALAKSIDAALARVAREAVLNIVKHSASPRTVALLLTFPRDAVTLRVVNSPHRPGTSSLSSSGFGLARLRERAALLGGSFHAGAAEGVWSVVATLPQR
ncbi:histidine kinase [Microbacterium sp. LTA6]